MKKALSIIFLLIGLSISSFAQKITVTGTVKDESGVPLIGVAVIEKGTSNGTVTDMDGKYTIKCQSDATLEFSYLSYKTKEEEVNGRTKIDVTLKDDENWPTFPGGVLFLSQLDIPTSDIIKIKLRYFEIA